jgi:hypothetical protein
VLDVHIGMPGAVSWQCMPSQSVPVPVQAPAAHCFAVASLMHLPLTGQAASVLHQQHWSELPQRSWWPPAHPLVGPPSHTVLAGQAWLPPALQVGATTEQPALSTNCPPLHVPPPEQWPLLQPPLAPLTFRPSLLHSAFAVHRQ